MIPKHQPDKNKARLWLLAALIATLILAFLSNPGRPYPILAWFCLTPLLYCLQTHQLSSPFKYSLIVGTFGLSWWMITVPWLIPAAINFIGMTHEHALLLYGVCCLLFSLPYWFIGGLFYYCKSLTTIPQILAQASIVTLIISCFSPVIPGNFTHSLYPYPQLIQTSALGGQATLLFAAFISSAFLAQSLAARSWRFGLYSLIPIISCYAYSSWVLNHKTEPLERLKIASIQPNLKRQSQLDEVIQQTLHGTQNYQESLDLVVWPELPNPFSYSENASQQQKIKQMIKVIKTPILLSSGYVYAEQQAADTKRYYYNASQLIGIDGKLLGHYYKQKLVPFFEYLPYEQQFPGLRQAFPHSLDYIPGSRQNLIPLTETIKITALICYESLFTELLRQQVLQGANVFINPGNDGWFGASLGSESHLALALFRSVEYRLSWIRVNNSGISLATSAYGELISGSRTKLNEKTSKVFDINILPSGTLYSRYPYGFNSILILLLLAIFIQHQLKQIRRRTAR